MADAMEALRQNVQGNAVRVTSEIGQHLLGSGERALGIDVPLGVIEGFEEGLERGLV
jgi:hypothetical protein